MTPTKTLMALEQASQGLTYQSETDAPWEVVSWPTTSGAVNADEVRKKGKHKAGMVAEEKNIDEFFAPLTEAKDWYGDEEKAVSAQYRSLLNVIKSALTDLKVFRVGEKEVTIYVVGKTKEGGWAGLKTTAVET